VPQLGTDPTFVTIPAGETLGTASMARTTIPGDGQRFAYSRMQSDAGGGFNFLFDVLQFNRVAWLPLAPTLIQTDGGLRFGAAYGGGIQTLGPYIARVREVGGVTGIEMHEYVP
jgi:hypothetical protein